MKPGDPLVKALKGKRKPKKGKLATAPGGFGKRVEGASTSTSRVGY